MKKILLSLMLIALNYLGYSQAIFNEIWYNPNTSGGNDEYIEIFNPGGNEYMGCYTVLSYYNNGTDSGFIAINYPNDITLAPGHWSVLSSETPVTHQSILYNMDAEDFSWTDPNLVSRGGYIKNFRATGNTYATATTPSNMNDILQDLGNNVPPANQITLLYKNGVLVNALAVGVGNKTQVPAKLKTMPPLDLPADGAGCAEFTATFSTLTNTQLEYMGSGIGANNGVHRTADGKCGSWVKSASSSDDTPGSTNGPSPETSGTITVGGGVDCNLNQDGTRNATAFVVKSQTAAAAYPLVLVLYSDNGSIQGQLDFQDEFVAQQTFTTPPGVNDPNPQFFATLPYSGRSKGIIVIARSTAGCFETIELISNSCIPLPVQFKSFNATRTTSSNVAITWTTAMEQNSKGFNVQKNVGGEWKTIAFVFSQAEGGNSSSDLSYSFKDVNNEKGITQYRIQQVDLDGMAKYSDIKAIRGESTASKMVVYPNPSVDGKLNVVFENNSGVRDVQVADMQGRIVKSFKGITNNILVIERLTSGFYTIKVTNRNTAAISVEKVVVK